MWPRVGGHVGPPTPLTPEVDRFELMPWRSSPPPDEGRAANALTHVLNSGNQQESSSPPYTGSSCVLTSYIFTLAPPVTCPLLQYQQAFQMPRRSYQRTFRRIQQPYRITSLSERMPRYRPVLPSLQEEETPVQRPNIEVQEIPSRIAIPKRQNGVLNTPFPSGVQIVENTGDARRLSQTPVMQRISPNDWTRTRQSHWQQPDEPEIIITSDVQLQTDDNETGYNSSDLSSLRQSSSPDIPESSTANSESSSPQTDVGVTVSENIPDIAAYIDVETDNFPPNDPPNDSPNIDENHITEHTESVESEVPESYSSPNSKESIDSDNQSPINKSLKVLTSASMVPFKLRSHSMPELPTPTFKARQVANSVIKHARNNKTINEKALYCRNCQLFPIAPVTGLCGHTRCFKCIERHGNCPCGSAPPKNLHVNTAIQYLMGKMFPDDPYLRGDSNPEPQSKLADDLLITSPSTKSDLRSEGGMVMRSRRHSRAYRSFSASRRPTVDVNMRLPMTPQVRFEYARRLMTVGRYRDAAPHFARVAASSAPRARPARFILAQLIMVLEEHSDERRVARDLFRSVRLQAAASWLRPNDLECALCCHTLTRPVTTPCGHTYCRTCIERAMDYRKVCALCLRPLEDFNLATANETEIVSAALVSIDESQPLLPLEPDVIPIFVCTVAFPSISCPLFIFDPRYWMMIRRVLESGSRKFGMVAYERDRNYSDYGTVLEVRDCVSLEDGRSFLSTIGLYRFRVIERDVRDGCDVARIQQLTDLPPTENMSNLELRCFGSRVLYKALIWMNGMNETVRMEIENAFGEMPTFDNNNVYNDGWVDSPDGPIWLWWLISILPLRAEIKVLILSTKNLIKRLMAVARTLDAIDHASITTTASSECEIRSALTNAEEWLERGS